MPPKNNTKQTSKRSHDDIDNPADAPTQRGDRRKAVKVHHEPQAITISSDEMVPSSQAVIEAVASLDKQQSGLDPNFVVKFSANLENDKFVISRHSSDLFQSYLDEEAAFRKVLNAQIAVALAVPATKHDGSAGNDVARKETAQRHPLWEASQQVLKLCFSLSKRYEGACQLVDNVKPMEELGARWTDHCERLSSELQMGYRVAQRQIARVVGRKDGNATEDVTDTEAVMEDERMAKVLQMKVPEQAVGVNGGLAFHDSLNYAESGLRRLVKGLPIAEVMEE